MRRSACSGCLERWNGARGSRRSSCMSSESGHSPCMRCGDMLVVQCVILCKMHFMQSATSCLGRYGQVLKIY